MTQSTKKKSLPKNLADPQKEQENSSCDCVQNPFDSLPPEIRPTNRSWKSKFRQVICPGCGLSYWTNISSDLCLVCKKKRGKGSD